MAKHVLSRRFYLTEDVLALSKALLGKILVTNLNNCITSGMIVETEAYNGVSDKASHAYNHRRTLRTETMYAKGGIAYIYLCYGIHHLFNVVTGVQNNPQAILVRAIEPLEGIAYMLQRRNVKQINPKLTSGPGVLSQALGITKSLDGASLRKGVIWIEDRGIKIENADIQCSPRIGIDYAEDHKDLPWRFYLHTNKWVSRQSK